MELDEIIRKIVERTGLNEREVREKIAKKRRDLSNLISEEGAAYIVAKELGIDLIRRRIFRLKIKNVISGMRNVNLLARIVSEVERRKFTTRYGDTGEMASFWIGDETGVIRVVLWNEEVRFATNLRRGDVVSIENAYTRDNLGSPEVRIGKRGKLVLWEGEANLPTASEIEEKFKPGKALREYERKPIAKLRVGDSAELKATVVQLFRIPPLFYSCPICGAKLKAGRDCEEHGTREAHAVVAGILDDGTANLRFVAFREQAEAILNASVEEIEEKLKSKENTSALEDIIANSMLGRDFIFRGFVKYNKLFERLEFVVNEVREVDVRGEMERLLGEIEKLSAKLKE